MKLHKIKEKIASDEYDFLRNNEHLGKNIILLGLGGSHAYGTENENSDVDLRGVFLNSKSDILGIGEGYEQYDSNATDTVIYSFNKIVKLLTNCNPNVIELLGLNPEHYLYISDVGQELLDNKKIFLSKKAVFTFGGYASSQLRRLDNKSARLVDQERHEQHILNSIRNASHSFPEKYFTYPSDAINLYVDKAVSKDFTSEIFMDINLNHYPLRDYASMWDEMKNIVSSYNKIGKRNKNAIDHGKLAKHMCHLIRLYIMALDILEKEEIVTYRENEHNLLMDIRSGKYLDSEQQPTKEFTELVDYYEKRLEYAKNHTNLPDCPDYDKIRNFVINVNERIVKGEI